MKKRVKIKMVSKDHPEVTEIKNICDVFTQDAETKAICEKILNEDKKKNRL